MDMYMGPSKCADTGDWHCLRGFMEQAVVGRGSVKENVAQGSLCFRVDMQMFSQFISCWSETPICGCFCGQSLHCFSIN